MCWLEIIAFTLKCPCRHWSQCLPSTFCLQRHDPSPRLQVARLSRLPASRHPHCLQPPFPPENHRSFFCGRDSVPCRGNPQWFASHSSHLENRIVTLFYHLRLISQTSARQLQACKDRRPPRRTARRDFPQDCIHTAGTDA